jgi:hypothetical protein
VCAWFRSLFALSLLAATSSARAAKEVVYVALGGWAELPGVARTGDPDRVASSLEQAGHRVRVVDLTVAGAKARTVREAQLSKATALRASLVTISIGPLDAEGGTSLEAFSRDLHLIADLLDRVRAKVVISTVPLGERLRAHASARHRRRVDSFNWAIRHVARRYGFALADVRAEGGTEWQTAVRRAAARALAPAQPKAPGRGVEGLPPAPRVERDPAAPRAERAADRAATAA